jgi:hypothetical protein
MNKLRFEGYWANRPRDLANLARFTSHELERQINWQVVPISRPWTDWMDSPVLYLASHKAPMLSNNDFQKIRSYIESGGMLFMQADGDSPEFQLFARESARRLFPQYEPADLPADHPIYNVMYRIPPVSGIKAVSNGSRVLILWSNTDISQYWQKRDPKKDLQAFQFGANVFVYAAGKRDLRNRLVSTHILPVQSEPTARYRIARVQYAGNWDPEPGAWKRFARWFQLETGYALDVVQVPIRDLDVRATPIAAITGTDRHDFTTEEAAAIRRYVESGGVLLIDVTGGAGTFDQSVKDLIYTKAFFDHLPRPISANDPLLAASENGMENLSKPRLRQFVMDTLGANAGLLEQLSIGKGHVIVSPLDITSGLLGTGTWGIIGYEPRYAQSLVKNVILWALDGAPNQPSP